MTIPAIFTGDVVEAQKNGVVDVQTIMDDFETLVKTTMPVASRWTQPGGVGTVLISPTDAAGRFFDVLFTRIAAGNLECRVRNQNAATICTRRMQIDVAGTEYRMFASAFGFHIDSYRATPEFLCGGMLDQSPELQTSNNNYVYGHGSRTNADALTNNDNTSLFMLDNGVATLAQRTTVRAIVSSATIDFRTASGAFKGCKVEVLAVPLGGGNNKFHGQTYNLYYVDTSLVAGSLHSIPVDDATNKNFRILAAPPNATGAYQRRLAMRVT